MNLILCKRLKKEMPGLDKAPFMGSIGELIKENVSKQAFNEWIELQIRIINEERLDLSEVSAQERLFDHMVEFLGLVDLVKS